MGKGCSTHHHQLLRLAALAKQQQADFSPAKQGERHRGTEQLRGKAEPISSHPSEGNWHAQGMAEDFVLVFIALLRGNGQVGVRELPARQARTHWRACCITALSGWDVITHEPRFAPFFCILVRRCPPFPWSLQVAQHFLLVMQPELDSEECFLIVSMQSEIFTMKIFRNKC